MKSFPLSNDRRLAGLLATVLVHATLILAWQMTRTLPSAPDDDKQDVMQWLHLPPPAPVIKPTPALLPVEPRQARASAGTRASDPAPVRTTPATASAAPSPAAQEAPPAPAPMPETAARPSAATILENARRSVGSIDRALRKESRPLIVAPLDSPELRMREGMEQAHAMAPPRLFEAPKVEELVNNTGDGARRTRVITGNRTYCVTERSPVTNVEMIEMHGKIRLTNCPSPETPAKRQQWRTARD